MTHIRLQTTGDMRPLPPIDGTRSLAVPISGDD
jgi:hypothetical protein